MTPQIIYSPAPSTTYRRYPNRPVRGGFMHHTGDPLSGPYPNPSKDGSWQYIFPDDGSIVITMADSDQAAFGVLKTDLLRPSWLVRCPGGGVSDANYCSVQAEVEYAPQNGETPNGLQHDSIRYWLANIITPKYGIIPFLGHGQVQSDKWPSEPHGLDWAYCGFGAMQPYVGRFFVQEPEHMNPADPAQIKSDLEIYGVGVNLDTGIMQFVSAAYQAGDPPQGNWRGPARWAPDGSGGELPGIGEYSVYSNTPDWRVRHRFTAGIVEYNPFTGGIGWMELVNNPAAIDEGPS